MNNEQMFAAGFRAQCAQRGVDPDALIKAAYERGEGELTLPKVLVEGAGGAVRGGALGGMVLGGAHAAEGIRKYQNSLPSADAINPELWHNVANATKSIRARPGRTMGISAAVLALLAMSKAGDKRFHLFNRNTK